MKNLDTKLLTILLSAVCATSATAATELLAWPNTTMESRPWSYWWWMGSAVDRTNVTRELQRYHDAGWGGLHIIPIYQAKGWEDRRIEYLNPEWMAMLRHTVTEARRLGMGIDMTTGTGWCFGGPGVTPLEANAVVVSKTFDLEKGQRIETRFDPKTVQAIVAIDTNGAASELTANLREDGILDWGANGSCCVYAISQRPSGQMVKRAAPGGAGHMLNLFYARGVSNYLQVFTSAFRDYQGPTPRAMYHDSYEYKCDWAPDLFAQFERRRGYKLQEHLPALLGKEISDKAARVKCDYRETLSDIMVEETVPAWVKWCRDRGLLTRNEAHGSPGNLLDLYALADIPETEMFHTDRNKLVSKLASSAAHVSGRKLVAAETGTWLKEHFTETLADMKYLVDDLFLSGVNHVIYHGSCYSPDEAAWPGWLFYASYEMNPRNSIWHDVPALSAYVSRCQSVLQSGEPDEDLLLYWPIHDFWQQSGGMEQRLTVHGRGWFEGQPFGRAAQKLWNRGFTFDFCSDRQLATAAASTDGIKVTGGSYRAVLVPHCDNMPVQTLARLLALARSGATVIFEDQVPGDVPGLAELEHRRAERKALVETIEFKTAKTAGVQEARVGRGRLLVGDVESALSAAGAPREVMVDTEGLMFVRRQTADGRQYLVANRGTNVFSGWLPLATEARAIAVLDPMSGRVGGGAFRSGKGTSEVRLRLEPGESLIIRASRRRQPAERQWLEPSDRTIGITGTWQVRFVTGGPELPGPVSTTNLVSWTELGGEEAQRFAGTAIYSTRFAGPPGAARKWALNLGNVCQSARVRLNGQDLGTLICPPFRVVVSDLRKEGNELEVEVTNVSANRIRDLDRRKVQWKNFHDINFVNIDYKPFDASNWPLADSGLLGPVTLQEVRMGSD
jgi:hypothetical protein